MSVMHSETISNEGFVPEPKVKVFSRQDSYNKANAALKLLRKKEVKSDIEDKRSQAQVEIERSYL